MKKKKVIFAFGIPLLFIFGLSYAFFSFSASSDTQTINTGKFSLSFDDTTPIINASNIYPINGGDIEVKATKKHFTVTNNGNQNMYLNIKLDDIIMTDNSDVTTSILKNKYFRFALYDNSVKISIGTFNNLNTTSQVIKLNIPLNANEVKNYDLYIWIEDSHTEQNEMMDKKFSAKISVEGLQTETITTNLVPNTNLTTIANNQFLCDSCAEPLTGELDLSYLTNLNTINADAFKGNGITSLNLPVSLTTLSGFRENQISGILDLSYLTNLTSIGAYTFLGNSITSINLPISLTSISSNAFYNNSITGILDLSNLTNLTSISASAFQYNQITCVKLPSSLIFANVSSAFDGSVTECN